MNLFVVSACVFSALITPRQVIKTKKCRTVQHFTKTIVFSYEIIRKKLFTPKKSCMLQKVKPVAWMAIVLICFTGIAGIAWQNNPVKTNDKNFVQDTTPKKEKLKDDETIITGDLDKTMEQVEKAQLDVQKQLMNKDWEKMHKNLLKAHIELNTQNLQEQLVKAMKGIDIEKIQLQTQEALQKIDWNKMEKELQKAQEEIKVTIDSKKMDAEIGLVMEEAEKAVGEIKEVDMEKIQQQLEQAKEELKMNQGSMQKEIENAMKGINEGLKIDLKKELEKAKLGIENAKEELRSYKNMLDEMDKEGLLNEKGQYSVKYKNGELFINGVKQSDTITNKYKHYFKKEKVIIKSGDEDDDEKTIHL